MIVFSSFQRQYFNILASNKIRHQPLPEGLSDSEKEAYLEKINDAHSFTPDIALQLDNTFPKSSEVYYNKLVSNRRVIDYHFCLVMIRGGFSELTIIPKISIYIFSIIGKFGQNSRKPCSVFANCREKIEEVFSSTDKVVTAVEMVNPNILRVNYLPNQHFSKPNPNHCFIISAW